MTARAALRKLAERHAVYEPGTAAEKRALLAVLARARLATAREVLRLHEILCFLRAQPDDEPLLADVERMLERFHARPDLRRHRATLVDTGIAGTVLEFPFFARTAQRLARDHPERLAVDWPRFESAARLGRLLPLLALDGERAFFDDPLFSWREWLRRFSGGAAAFLIERWHALPIAPFVRNTLYDELDPPLRFRLGPDTPSRTRAKWAEAAIAFQTRPLARARPDLRAAIRRPPPSIRAASAREGATLIGLARDAMLTRQRDLEVFAYGNAADVRLVDCGDGLAFACIGVLPERRSLLEAVYGLLTLKNGVPIGYALCTALFESSEVAYNVFETFRGSEAAAVFGHLLATIHHLFGSQSFAIDPYQLGHHNDEGIASGAFWFYQKLGFRPSEPERVRLVAAELARARRIPGSRSTRATLRRLANGYVFWQLRERRDVLGHLRVANASLAVSQLIADRFGGDREQAQRTCLAEGAARLGVDRATLAKLTAPERQAWQRRAPLLAVIPDIERWTRAERRSLFAVVRAKGGPIESRYLPLVAGHRRLRSALRKLLVLRPLPPPAPRGEGRGGGLSRKSGIFNRVEASHPVPSPDDELT
jgi:hypothetical protein